MAASNSFSLVSCGVTVLVVVAVRFLTRSTWPASKLPALTAHAEHVWPLAEGLPRFAMKPNTAFIAPSALYSQHEALLPPCCTMLAFWCVSSRGGSGAGEGGRVRDTP